MMRKSWEKVLEIWEKMEKKNLREKIEERTEEKIKKIEKYLRKNWKRKENFKTCFLRKWWEKY